MIISDYYHPLIKYVCAQVIPELFFCCYDLKKQPQKHTQQTNKQNKHPQKNPPPPPPTHTHTKQNKPQTNKQKTTTTKLQKTTKQSKKLNSLYKKNTTTINPHRIISHTQNTHTHTHTHTRRKKKLLRKEQQWRTGNREDTTHR